MLATSIYEVSLNLEFFLASLQNMTFSIIFFFKAYQEK